MAIQPPNNGLVTETAQQYFQGSQDFRGDGANTTGQQVGCLLILTMD